MTKTKKMGTILLASVLIIGLSGCGNQNANKTQAQPAKPISFTVTKPSGEKIGRRALEISEKKASQGLKMFVDSYKGMNSKWVGLIKSIEVKFVPVAYIRINTTVENNAENLKLLKTAVPTFKTWAANSCKTKIQYVEFTDKQGKVLYKENLNLKK